MKHKIFLIYIALIATVSTAWADISFKASAPRTVAVGQQFKLSYTLNDKGKDIRIPEMTGFEVKFGPAVSQGQSVLITGSQVNTQITETYTYTLQAKEEGDFEIAPGTITVGNSSYQSNSLTIKVVSADKAVQAAPQRGNRQEPAQSVDINAEDIFLRAHVSKNSMYENEGVLITYKLYYRINLLDNSYPTPNFENFISHEIENPSNIPVNVENYNGKTYRTFVMRQYVIYPQKSGTITIPGEKIEILASFLVRRAQSFFDNDQYSNVKKAIHSNSVTVNVKPLPSGKPASFTGAVGDYKMTSSITSENVKTNEGLTIKLNISGSGNLKMIQNPEFTFPNGFEIYDPKVNLNTKTTARGVSGSKSIEYLVIPRYAGDFTIPSVEFSYFDPVSGTYKRQTTPEYNLHVERGKGGETASQSVVSYSNKEDLRYLGKDIRYIKTNNITLSAKDSFIYGSLFYVLSYLIPALLFIIFFIIYRKQAKENANIALVKNKKANKVATKRLKLAGKLLKENKKEDFYDEVLRAVWGYLSDKLNIPVSSLSKENIESELSKYGAEESLTKELLDILNTCEYARYAPADGTEQMDKLYESTIQAINKMENTIKK